MSKREQYIPSKREEYVRLQVQDERSHQFYRGVGFVLFEVLPAFAQVAILIACAFVFCGCFGG